MQAQTVERIDAPPRLPVAGTEEFFPHPWASPPPRVLVVDDEPLIRWSVAETLTARGYQVIETGSGDSAIYMVMSAPPGVDVILLDLVLPDFHDLSLLAVLRRLAPAVPIVMMTAFATPALIERARALGAFCVIDKPFEMNDLAPVVRQAILAARRS